MPAGRPSTYNQETAAEICQRIAEGETLRKICASEGMPVMSTIFAWLAEHEEFSKQYAKAREVQQEQMAEEILEISDDGRNDTYTDENGNERTNSEVVARSRLRVDARKWLLSKMAPKKYGDRLDVTAQNTNHNINQDAGEIDMTKLSGSELEALTSLLKKTAK